MPVSAARFAGGPIKRVGRARFLRNVMIAIGNSGDRSLIAAALSGITADSALVRAMAAWALGRLAAPAELEAFALRFASEERDAEVMEEWKIALSVPAER